ncbi:hypothetical protein KMZ32_10900 [Phycicoccus sp. MAQZ13P-2]|uniref:Rv3654c family TadE-like protein n=1 Tax=Phycicoccus mangrovi TaxID=2840470 RepID=UPI001BFFF5AC|nr:Rv3654c family TadE-like protein [Phycicoccus mangrovi]MBT9257773.1 hypothetical protein [Phycicoccus mangrovi]MBT9274578.1 hypothetical protein [Phycicoccus mangrovi]
MSATVLVVGAAGAVVAVATGGLVLAGVATDVHRARAAADLGALAAAGPLVGGGPPDCTAAADVATRNGARLVACGTGEDGSVVVRVSVPLGVVGRPGVPSVVDATARAGPVTGGPG